jgi:uncharacterized protein YutE (UPF0331/DUF86 family)
MPRRERRAAFACAVADLRRYRARWTLEQFLADGDAQRLVLHALYVAVQACVDEAFEALRDRGLASPASYRESFLALAAAGVLTPDLAGRLARWAAFRNVLAHFYPVLDLGRVYAAIQDLADLEAFTAAVDSAP